MKCDMPTLANNIFSPLLKRRMQSGFYIHLYKQFFTNQNLIIQHKNSIQGVIESCTDILTTSYWVHVEPRR
jgi:hypothetical protein